MKLGVGVSVTVTLGVSPVCRLKRGTLLLSGEGGKGEDAVLGLGP